MKTLIPLLSLALVGCGVFGNDEVDEDAAEVYVGNWAIQALESEEPEEIENPVDYAGELAIDKELDADYSLVFRDGDYAYEIDVAGPVTKANAEVIENDVEGLLGRVPLAGGEVELFELIGQLQCEFLAGGLVCNVFAVAQDNDEFDDFGIDLDSELIR